MSAHARYKCDMLPKYFDLLLVKSMDADPSETEGQLPYILSHVLHINFKE